MKMVAFDSGVNVTLGLPIIRTSIMVGLRYCRQGHCQGGQHVLCRRFRKTICRTLNFTYIHKGARYIMFKAEGLITPVVTALTETEEFNKKEYQAFIDHLIKAGVHGISRWGRTANSMHFRLKKNWKSSKLPSKPSRAASPSMPARAVLRRKKQLNCPKQSSRWAVSIAYLSSPHIL